MVTWLLIITYGITGWGAGGRYVAEYPSEEACYKALNNLVVHADNQTAGEDDEQMFALCQPKVAE
jgi:hypothetical protein